ncbi:unnamed protein product, partial [Ixodes hexagonus]
MVSVIPLLLLLFLVAPGYLIYIYKTPTEKGSCHYEGCAADELEPNINEILALVFKKGFRIAINPSEMTASLMAALDVDVVFHWALRRTRNRAGVIMEFDLPDLIIKPELLLTKNLTLKASDERVLMGAAQEAITYLGLTRDQIEPQNFVAFIVSQSKVSQNTARAIITSRSFIDDCKHGVLAGAPYVQARATCAVFRRFTARGARHVTLLSSVIRRLTFSISAAASLGDLPGFLSIEEAMLRHATLIHGDYFNEGEKNPVFQAKIGHQIGRAIVKVIDPSGTCYNEERVGIDWLYEAGRTKYIALMDCIKVLYNVTDEKFKV